MCFGSLGDLAEFSTGRLCMRSYFICAERRC